MKKILYFFLMVMLMVPSIVMADMTQMHHDAIYGPDENGSGIRGRLERLEGRVGKIESRLEQLNEIIAKQFTEVQNGIKDLKATSEQYRVETKADTNRVKEETTSTAKRAEEAEKKYQETLKRVDSSFQEIKQKFDDYQKKVLEDRQKQKLDNQRRERIYDAFYNIYELGEIRDPTMADLFARASAYSEEFRKILDELKTIPKVRQMFRQKAARLEELFWSFLKQQEELIPLLDQPMPLMIEAPTNSKSSSNNDESWSSWAIDKFEDMRETIFGK